MDITEITSLLALTLGAGWASGINLYAAVFALGMAGATGYVELPDQLDAIQNPWVIGAASLMYLVEFIVDKIPGVDSIWDIVHTFIRVPAGALMALGATGDQGLALEMVGGLAGGAMALNSHAVKMGSRAAINTSPEPFSNWAASITEDISVVGGLWLALSHPWLFLGLLVLFVGFSIFLLRMIWSTLKPMIRKVRSWWDRRGDADGEGNGAVRVGGAGRVKNRGGGQDDRERAMQPTTGGTPGASRYTGTSTGSRPRRGRSWRATHSC